VIRKGAEANAPPGAALNAQAALGLFATMWRIRVFEERVGALKRDDELYGLIRLSVHRLHHAGTRSARQPAG
jgi:TPP-dependent pyruvate/acetoin dehydrogenase alpha subunit